MRLAVNKMTALRVLRGLRSSRSRLPSARTGLVAPDPAPRRRWSASAFPLEPLGLSEPPTGRRPVDVAVPEKGARIQPSFAACTIYSSGLPEGSFVPLGNGLLIPCPELLFLELAPVMAPVVHVLLGYELCGSFSRDARDPRMGDVAFDVPPVASVESIGRFFDACHNVRGIRRARRSLAYLADNAWSPMEAVVGAMAALPVALLGYELGPVRLNARYDNPPELVALGCRASRVPDIEIAGTCAGFNYDGREHFDPGALEVARSEGDRLAAARSLREKYVDDLRRNRELAARGRIVLPVTAEDLFAESGLDAVMLEAAGVIERFDGGDMGHVRESVASAPVRRARQRLVWSLLPWGPAEGWAREIVERERPKAMRVIEEDVEF